MIKRVWLAVELGLIFLAVPGFLYFHVTRLNVHLAMWAIALGVFLTLRRSPNFSWHEIWHGLNWPIAQRKKALLRFAMSTLAIIILTGFLAPDHMFAFPISRPWFWLLVMVLYPVLSVVPQELVFRRFFFRRYAPLFPHPYALLLASAVTFSLAHIVFHNFVSPILCLIGGLIFAHSYSQHRSLKWVAIEHAAYGCMIFTVGLGLYFLVGGIKP